jgi:hypothetical protein
MQNARKRECHEKGIEKVMLDLDKRAPDIKLFSETRDKS